MAEITMHLWREGRIVGLFLSSSVFKDPDHVTEKQLEVLRTLRNMGYHRYVHLRLMPGVSQNYVREAIELTDRVGVNIEAPSKEVLNEVQRAKPEAATSKFGFAKAGVDTQMIVVAVDDTRFCNASRSVSGFIKGMV